MGSNETAITIPGGLVIDAFDGNEAPSDPNCLLFGADRLAALWDRSESGSHQAACAVLCLRRPDRNLWQIMAKAVAQRTVARGATGSGAAIARPVPTPEPPGIPDHESTDPTGASLGGVINITLKKLFFSPQHVSRLSL